MHDARDQPARVFHLVLRLLVNGWPPERLAELLPNRIAALHPALAVPASGALPEPGERPQMSALPAPLEGTLLEKLRKIEALHAGTAVEGEREAARRAAERIRARLADLRGRAEDVELHYRLPDPWKRRLFVALCRRYGLKPFREAGRRYSTVQVRAPKAFHDKTLWPEYLALAAELEAHLDEFTTRVIREAIDEDVTEATETAPKALLPEPDDR